LCQMCAEHGLGRKWYLQPRNYEASKANVAFIEEFFSHWEQFLTKRMIEEKTGFLKELVKNHRGQVVPLEDAVRIMKTAEEVYGKDFVAVASYCGCRKVYAAEWLPVCIGWGVVLRRSSAVGYNSKIPDEWKRYKVATGFIEERPRYPLTADSAAELMKEWEDKQGLVHAVFTFGIPYVGSICNCETPYCVAFRDRFHQGISELLRKGEYIGVVDPDACIGCGKCKLACQFGAINLPHLTGRAVIDPTKCFGCGVCRSFCDQRAITLVDRAKVPAARNLW